MEQSIETVRLYPHTLNVRPTLIAIPQSDPGQPEEILPRLVTIQNAYRKLVEQDAANQVLGAVDNYYRLYQREELERLAQQQQANPPQSDDEWVIPFAQHADLAQLKYPVVLVQEYGWSVFRLAASVDLTLEALPNCQVMLRTELVDATFQDNQWRLTYLDAQGSAILKLWIIWSMLVVLRQDEWTIWLATTDNVWWSLKRRMSLTGLHVISGGQK